MFNSETTVKEVALQMPESTRLFEQLKIDYCCGGNQPLGEACSSAGLDVEAVMATLAQTSSVAQSSLPAGSAGNYQNQVSTKQDEGCKNSRELLPQRAKTQRNV